MNLKRVGFFKEMPHGLDSQLSIMDYINKANKDVDRISNYLREGIEVIVSPGVVNDIINDNKGIAGTSSLYTDGEWIWPGDLAYYVKEYKLKLPDEFIESMNRNSWKVKLSIDDLELDSLTIDGELVY